MQQPEAYIGGAAALFDEAGTLINEATRTFLTRFMAAFAVFNSYMLLFSMRTSKAVFAVFLTLEATLIIYFIGQFLLGSGHTFGTDLIHVSGYVGVATAAAAWYASAAGVINGMSPQPVLPVGTPLWPATAARTVR